MSRFNRNALLAALSALTAMLCAPAPSVALSPAARLVVVSAIAPETVAIVRAMPTRPTTTRVALIDRTVRPIKGVLQRCDAFGVTAALDQPAALDNWANPAVPFTVGGSPTFTADRGFTGNGTDGYVDLRVDPTTAAKFSRDSGAIGAWERVAVASDTAYSVGQIGTDTIRLNGRTTVGSGGAAAFRLNDSTSLTLAQASAIGLTAGNRSASNAKQLYKDGVSVATSATASAAPVSGDLVLLRSNSTFGTRAVAAAFVCGSLTAAQHLAVYTALSAYMTAVGVQ